VQTTAGVPATSARRATTAASPRGAPVGDRDLVALEWIGEQAAVRLDVVARLLGGTAPVGDRVARRRVERWHQVGLVDRRRFLVGSPPVVWLTRAGARTTEGAYRSTPPSIGLLDHLHAVCLVRLGVEAAGGDHWVSERALHRARPTPEAHVPDGRFRSPRGVDTAVEVELTPKAPHRLRRIVDELTVDHDAVLYVVRGARVRAGVERARDAIGEPDRVAVVDLADCALVAAGS